MGMFPFSFSNFVWEWYHIPALSADFEYFCTSNFCWRRFEILILWEQGWRFKKKKFFDCEYNIQMHQTDQVVKLLSDWICILSPCLSVRFFMFPSRWFKTESGIIHQYFSSLHSSPEATFLSPLLSFRMSNQLKSLCTYRLNDRSSANNS